MLGFGAIGVNPVAIGPRGAGVIAQAILGTIAAKSYIKVQASNSTAVSASIKATAKSSAQSSNSAAILGRIKATASSKAPAGFAIKGIIAAKASARVAPGYLLFARAAMNSSGLSALHMEGTIIGDHRDPLLLNPGSQYGASYWRGRG